ncbi:UL36 very large tegument protein [Streptomyces sp. Je 1-79]|uniref:UL36 very large tegument protein n=1 Tax=Streptomyces sp. Je 1-79 TaxID=2943847 RepID=UPI0021A54117|nr:UL36 very large tegument protein [Streptomyces sp. Je 1-79]MCT4353079.1 UL36 very large tegument protein [Streptomyces sp. Je 1-79]
MTVYQLPAEVGAFARHLRAMAARLVPGEGWYGVFASRDPEGLRACFDGTEILPWDVVESLLQDLGEPPLGPGAVRARALHGAAAAAHDRRPGGARALGERLEAMERERRYAEGRAQELGALLRQAPGGPDAERIGGELAWVQDDHARATARIAELTTRLAALTDGREPAPTHAPRSTAGPGSATTGPGSAAGPGPAPAHPPRLTPDPAPEPAAPRPDQAAPKPAPAVRRKPRGARYAWLDESEAAEEAQQVVPAPLSVPELPVAGAAPRGARFGGVETEPAPAPRTPPREVAADAARAAGNAVYALQRLRSQGRSGEAHALLCEAVAGPPAWLPALAAELHRVGLGADWATLLWEAALLPPGHLAAVAGALADAGRPEDCERLLRQGVARPADELAGACAALHAEGHHREAHALLTAFLQARTPEDAAHLAAADPHVLVPQLRTAARALSPALERDLLHALRVAGLAGA